jgi:hypothetical protein
VKDSWIYERIAHLMAKMYRRQLRASNNWKIRAKKVSHGKVTELEGETTT